MQMRLSRACWLVFAGRHLGFNVSNNVFWGSTLYDDRHEGFKASDSKTRRKVLTFWTNFEPNDNFCKHMWINTRFLCMRDALVKGF